MYAVFVFEDPSVVGNQMTVQEASNILQMAKILEVTVEPRSRLSINDWPLVDEKTREKY